MKAPDPQPASFGADAPSSTDPAFLSPSEVPALVDFLEDISIAFEALYENGDITATEYLASTLGQFDELLGNGECRGPSPRT